MTKTKNIIANVFLFISSVLLLINVAPSDFYPNHQKMTRAVELLKKERNILKPLKGIKIDFGKHNGIFDESAFELLKEFVKENSPQSGYVDWQRATGIGYLTISLPVAKNKLEAFRPLYIALIPNINESDMDLIPVGEFLDLNKWLASHHQGSLTITALILLTIGFFMQLFASIWPKKSKRTDCPKEQIFMDYQI